MTLPRESLFSLIGNDRRRYHSAILTTFSFDPDFFEQRIMSHFRLCGIHNVNVLVDGYSFDEVVQQTAGRVALNELSSRYSIYPIFQQAIFHPKIWLLIGQNEGLLIVGSGNLTSAGQLSNDEIWGAFHVNATVADNQPLFASAWAYVRRFTDGALGHFREKTSRWITDQASWIYDLPSVELLDFNSISRGQRIALLCNSPTQTIWQQLKHHIGNQKVIAITTVSPYYDQDGTALQALAAAYPNAIIRAVLDDRGRVPATMSLLPNVLFFDWNKAGVSRHEHARLHAKLIHWQTENGTEYCLFGSANVTSAGLGLPNTQYINAEASLLIEVPEGNVLSELGLVLSKESQRALSSFRVANNRSSDQLTTARFHQRARLYSAEVELDDLTIYWEADTNYQYQLHLFNTDNRQIGVFPANGSSEKLRIKLPESCKQVRFVQLVDLETQQPVSNKLPIADMHQLYKAYPNPALADIESIHAEILAGDMGRLLNLLTFAMNSEERVEQSSGSISHSNPLIRSEPDASSDLPVKALTEYRFADNLAEAALHHSPVLRVLELLRYVQNPVSVAEYYGDIQGDEQEEDLSTSTGSDVSKPSGQPLPNKSDCFAERRRVGNYLKQFTDYLSQLVSQENPNEKAPVTLTVLTKYLIALELLVEYGGKVIRYDDSGQSDSMNYLPFDEGDGYTVKSVKGSCLLLIGSFLHLTRFHFKKYSLPYSQNKIDQFRREALIGTVVCLLNVKWAISQHKYFKTLLLNTLHSLGWGSAEEYHKGIDGLVAELKERADLLKNRQACYESNEKYFIDELCPDFLVATIRRSAKSFATTANVNQLIYTSFTGYCYIVDKSSSLPVEYIVAKPGYKWNKARQTFCFEYPLKLSQFILVG